MDSIIPGAANLSLFVSATLVLLLVPGPAVLYIFARSVEQGRSAGLVSILGIHAATLVHVAAAAAGLSALLASSAIAFSVVKYAGAAYLIWLGFKKLFGPASIPNFNGVDRRAVADAFSARVSWSTSSIRKPRCSSSPFCRSLLSPRVAMWRCRSRSSGFFVSLR